MVAGSWGQVYDKRADMTNLEPYIKQLDEIRYLLLHPLHHSFTALEACGGLEGRG